VHNPAPAAAPGRPPNDPGHGVVAAVDDIAVVEQPVIGDPSELQPRLVIADALRLIGEIAAGQDYQLLDVLQKEVMERRVGQHKAERALAGRHCRGYAFAPLCRQHDNRRRRAQQQLLILRRHYAIAAHDIKVARHQRKGLVIAVLAGAQPLDCIVIAGVAGEVKAADTLYRDNRAIEE